MSVKKFFGNIKDSKNFFLGFYGGGNYGDELLMEILMNICEHDKIQAEFFYFDRVSYEKLHNKFIYSKLVIGYRDFIISLFRNKNIIFGGGGIFSEDTSFKHTVVLLLLFFLKYFFGKKIYAVGIGFYPNTTYFTINKLLFKNICSQIYVRDVISLKVLGNDKKIILDKDLSFLLKDSDFSGKYSDITIKKGEKIYTFEDFTDNKIFIFSFRKTIRNTEQSYTNNLLKYIEENKKKILYYGIWDFYYKSIQKCLKNYYI